MSIVGYYYLHTNGNLIYKPYDDGRVADFRDSDFVRAFWPCDPEDRETAWSTLIEAQAAGANVARVKELAEHWHCTNQDAAIYAGRVGVKLAMDGNKWCATGPGFQNLQESKAGFGDTSLEAMAELAKALGYHPTKMWGPTFKSVIKSEAKPAKAEAKP